MLNNYDEKFKFFIPVLVWQTLPTKLPEHWHWLPAAVDTHTPSFKQGLVEPQPTPVALALYDY